MKVKCSCGKIINCEPEGDCWCKQLEYKIKKSDINNKIEKCLCKNCLKTKIKKIDHSQY